MRRYEDAAEVEAAFAPYLEEGEQIRHLANGRRPPGCLRAFGVALIEQMFPVLRDIFDATRNYLIALTDRRLVVLRFKRWEDKVDEVQAWTLAAFPPVKAPDSWNNMVARWIEIEDPAQPFKAYLSPTAIPGQEQAVPAIIAALTGQPAAT